MINIGARFKKIREKAGYTREQTAAFLNIDSKVLTDFEAGHTCLNASMLESASRLFGCETCTFLSESEYQPFMDASQAKELSPEDLDAISKVQQIAVNLQQINRILNTEEKI